MNLWYTNIETVTDCPVHLIDYRSHFPPKTFWAAFQAFPLSAFSEAAFVQNNTSLSEADKQEGFPECVYWRSAALDNEVLRALTSPTHVKLVYNATLAGHIHLTCS